MEVDAMRLKQPDEIIRGLRIRFSSKLDNVIYLERFFVACSVVRWIYRETEKTEEILSYLAQVERHMSGEIDLYWDEGIIKVGKIKKGKS